MARAWFVACALGLPGIAPAQHTTEAQHGSTCSHAPLLAVAANAAQEAGLETWAQEDPSTLEWDCAQQESAPQEEHGSPKLCPQDSRTCIDVLAYDFQLDFTQPGDRFFGLATISLQSEHAGLAQLELDAGRNLRLVEVRLQRNQGREQSLPFLHQGDLLTVPLPQHLGDGETARLAVRYEGHLSQSHNQAWATERTAEGRLRMDCALQYSGAHFVYPCKASYYHPEDTARTTQLSLRVPAGLLAVGPGRPSQQTHEDGSATFRFDLGAPVPTWGLGFAIGPYEVTPLEWKSRSGDVVPVEVYRIRAQPAQRQRRGKGATANPSTGTDLHARIVEQVMPMMDVLEQAFGPYPFPESRLAIVETLSLSSANATWTGLRSDFLNPNPQSVQGEEAERTLQHALRVLAHELGHAWWGHGLSVRSWEDIWLHESFASYGELQVLGALQGKERQDYAYQALLANVSPKARLCMRGRAGRTAHTASNPVLWFKGPWVLRALQYEVGDDETWWGALATFQERHRFETVSTQDWIEVLEQATGQSWQRFFREWYEGQGYPRVRGKVRVSESGIHLEVMNHEDEVRHFHVPLDLTWTEQGEAKSQRILLSPGRNELFIHSTSPQDVAVAGLDQVLGIHQVRVQVPR